MASTIPLAYIASATLNARSESAAEHWKSCVSPVAGPRRCRESLCVTFHNQLYRSRSTLTFLPELVTLLGVVSGLADRQKNTVFSRPRLSAA